MNVIAAVRRSAPRVFKEYVYDNPIVTRDLRTRMRGMKAFTIMGAYVLFLAATLLISSFMILGDFAGTGVSVANRNVGGGMFDALVNVQTVLLIFIIPSLTSGALTREVEKKTIQLLVLTRLGAGRIVLGKHLSAVLYALMLLVCSLPLSGICLMYGGLSPVEVAVTYLMLFVWVILLAAIGVFWSSLFNRTTVAAVFSYASTGFYSMVASSMGDVALISGHGRSGAWVLMGLYPPWCRTLGLMSATVCNIHIPIAVITTVLHLAMSILLLTIAVMHVRHIKVDTSLPIRLLVVFISSMLIWLIFGDGQSTSGMRYTDLMYTLPVFGTTLLAIIGLAASILATGPIKAPREVSVLQYAFSPSKMFKGDLGGAIPFLLLWGMIAYGVYGCTLQWASRTYMGLKIPPGFWTQYFHVGVAMLFILMGIGSIGIMASSMTRFRRNTIGGVILFLLIIFFGYLIVLINYVPGISNSKSLIWQTAALWPLTSSEVAVKGIRDSLPNFWWPKQQTWIVTSIAYLIISLAALSIASKFRLKTGGVVDD